MSFAEKNPRVYLYAVLAPLIIVVIVSIITVYIAVRHADRPIAESYVKNGLSISNDHRLQDVANALGLTFRIACEERPPLLLLSGSGEDFAAPANLLFRLVHPVDELRDQEFLLHHAGQGRYSLPEAMIDADGKLVSQAGGFWLVQAFATDISGQKRVIWRLREENLNCTEHALLKAQNA